MRGPAGCFRGRGDGEHSDAGSCPCGRLTAEERDDESSAISIARLLLRNFAGSVSGCLSDVTCALVSVCMLVRDLVATAASRGVGLDA